MRRPESPDPWRARSICFSVPLEAGDRVLVVGPWPSVARSARLAGAEVLSADTRPAEPAEPDAQSTAVITDGRLPVPDGAMDHVLLPQLTPSLLPLASAELARVPRAGGWLFLGAPAVWRSGPRRGALSIRRGRAPKTQWLWRCPRVRGRPQPGGTAPPGSPGLTGSAALVRPLRVRADIAIRRDRALERRAAGTARPAAAVVPRTGVDRPPSSGRRRFSMIDMVLSQLRTQPEVASRLADLSCGRALQALQIGSRWEGRAVPVWSLFCEGADEPVLIVKVDHKKRSKQWLRNEHEALRALASRPELRGMVPEPVALFAAEGRRLVMAQTAVPGTPLSVLARQRASPSPRACAVEHRLVTDWLARLHGDIAAAARQNIDGAQVVEQAQEALAMVAADADTQAGAVALPGASSTFLPSLRTAAAAWPELTLPVLAGHGDLGPSNCLLGDGRIRVIDWEGGVGTRTPTADLVILLTHYARAQPSRSNRLPNHEDAFRAALLGDDWLAALTAATFRSQLRRLGVPPATEEYVFVAALAELASGQARTAHGLAQRYWARLLAIYAAGHERSWLGGEVSRQPRPG